MKHSSALTAALVFGAACFTSPARADQPIDPGPPTEPGRPEIVPHRLSPALERAPTKGGTSKMNPNIQFHGGPVIATPTAYVIWYGNWNQSSGSDTTAGKQIVTDFLNSIGGSPYFDINITYSTSTFITGGARYGGATTVAYPYGANLTDGNIASIVQNARNGGLGINDPTAVYFVLTSSDVNETSGFCTQYCGWHTRGTGVRYAFVGNANRCLNACSAQLVGPNGNAGVDAMISVIAHELEEATTDPDLNAWWDPKGAENADKCAWTFGQTLYQASNNAYYNMTLGARNYLIQRNLFHSSNGDYCATSASLSGNTVTMTGN
jgi:hypothetical protein